LSSTAPLPSAEAPARRSPVAEPDTYGAPRHSAARPSSNTKFRTTDASVPDDAEHPEEEAPTVQEAYQKILRIISVRERSSAYLRERLQKEEFPSQAVEEALEKAQRLYLVDDRRYSDALIRMRLAAGKGLRDAEQEIEELGIDPTTLDAWQEHAAQGPEVERERALALLRRRPPRAKNARDAAFRKLMSQGYSTDVAGSVARQWAEEQR
ncbi:MAG: RecX family transcriptional regulator, partial [Adlercreutzia sp.]|nr:RecX family transcriptional regulator [Adlercreutzia sp.]